MNLNTIVTKYLGPTNFSGTRIGVVGIGSDGYRERMVVSWDYSLNESENHARAAEAWHDQHCSDATQTYHAARSPKQSESGIWHFVPDLGSNNILVF